MKVEENPEINQLRSCIACLKNENQTIIEPTFTENIQEIYNTIVKDEINQLNLPSLNICLSCEATLTIILEFQQQCLQSIDSLRSNLNIGPEIVIIKQEIIDSEYEDNSIKKEEKNVSDDDSFEEEQKSNESDESFSEFIPLVKLEETPKKVRKSSPKTSRKYARKLEDGTKRYFCDVCDASYVKPIELRRHIMKKHQSGSQCKYCRHVFLDKNEFNRHMKKEAAKKRPETMLCCHECGYTSKWKAGLRKHITLYHSPDQPKLICEICGKRYVLRAQFKQHFIANHMEKQHQCNECGKRFAFLAELESHIKGQHSIEGLAEGPDAPVKCEFCEKTMKARSMRYHVRNVHLDVRNHNCSICFKSFNTKAVLNRHLGAHEKHGEVIRSQQSEPKTGKRKKNINNNNNPKKKLNCEICGLTFKLKTELTQHNINTHLDKETVERDYVACEFCSLKTKRTSMNMHVKLVHINAKPFKCDECGFAFNRHINLRKHQLIHKGIRPYNCNICSSGHWQTEQLRKHFEKAHELIYTLEEIRNICGKVEF